MKFYHFYTSKIPQLNSVAEKIKQQNECEIFSISFFKILLNLPVMIFSKDFWTYNYNNKSYYSFYRNNILKAIIRYPKIYRIKPLRKILYISFELRLHLTKCLILKLFKNKEPGVILIWNGARFPQNFLIEFANINNFKTLHFEIGHFPNRIQVDGKGVNFHSSLPSKPDFYLNYKFDMQDELPATIGVRHNKLKSDGKTVNKPKSYIFVVFQVPSDSQILVHSPWVKSMYHLYDIVYAMAEKFEHLNFVIKEHPSFKLKVAKNVKPHSRILFDNWGDTKDLIQNSEAVMTVNSTAGLEALTFGKKVITMGEANYNLPGLVLNAQNQDELIAHLSSLPQWSYDNILREQFLKYYYNKFLITGQYSNLNELTMKNIMAKLDWQ